MRIPFSPPRMDEKIINEVVDTLKSGWITTGPKTKLFEKKITDFCGHKASLCTSSGSAGLELMLRWFGVKEGDEVIIPAYTYAATANVVVHCGAKPVMADIDDSFNINPQELSKLINPKTKVIIPVDIAGKPCNYDEINKLVRKKEIQTHFVAENKNQEKLNRILILSDAAHSLGAKYKQKRTGTLTDITVFSFHAVKNLTTAEGGAICLNLPDTFDNEEVYKELNIKSLHGQTKDAFSKTKAGNWQYDIIEAGYKYNMTDIAASMGLVELDRYENDMLIKRKHIFHRYAEKLKNHKWAIIPEYKNEIFESSYHVFTLRIKDFEEEERNILIQKMQEKEISVNVHFIPLPLMSFYASLGFRIEDYPNAYAMFKNEISLPVYYDLNDKQIDFLLTHLIDSVEEILEKC